MQLSGNFRCFFLFLVVLTAIGLLPFSLLAEEKPAEQNDKPTPEEQKASLIEIYSWATILPKELIDLQNGLKNGQDIKAVEEELVGLAQQADEFKRETIIAGTTPDLQLNEVTSSQARLYKITTRLKKISEPITAAISDLSAKRTEWQSKKDQLSRYDKKEVLSLALAKEQQKILAETIDTALKLIEEQLRFALSVGKKIGDLQVILYSAGTSLKAMDNKLRAISIQQTSPSMLSGEFYTRINADLFRQSFSNSLTFIVGQLESLKTNRNVVLLCLFGFLLVGFGIYTTKSLISASSRWYPFAVFPIATTVFMASSLNTFMNMMPVNYILPQQWEALLHILVMIAAIRLTTNLIENKRWRRLLIRLVIFMAIARIMVVLDLSKILILLYVFYVSLVALIYYFYQLPGIKGRTDFNAWLRRYFGIFPAAVLIFGVSGYDQFAVFLFATLLSAVIACLVVWMLYLLHFGFLDLVLTLLPINVIGDYREVILKSLQPIVVCFHIFLLVAVQGVIWNFFSNLNEALAGILKSGFDIFSLHVSPGFVLTVILVGYGAFLVSKTIQMLLLNKILPGYGAEKGVQLSITRLVHYAILTIGFLVMLRVLGFQLNQLALLGGALGVGIGFGLQAIVSNFVSGLILLFERPIKVGDTIQVGTEIGEVKNLGLRATIIQTFDNAEIVVPNSDLVTGQVTNWTLGDRKVRVRVPVGVAYGTDVDKVLKILRACAKANPMVLDSPKPIAFFLAFGSSSLDFELRVWVLEFLDKIQVLSDLNQDIENEFSLNKIEIPFPQTDLHVRSVDEAAARIWRDSSPLPSDPVSSPAPDVEEKK